MGLLSFSNHCEVQRAEPRTALRSKTSNVRFACTALIALAACQPKPEPKPAPQPIITAPPKPVPTRPAAIAPHDAKLSLKDENGVLTTRGIAGADWTEGLLVASITGQCEAAGQNFDSISTTRQDDGTLAVFATCKKG